MWCFSYHKEKSKKTRKDVDQQKLQPLSCSEQYFGDLSLRRKTRGCNDFSTEREVSFYRPMKRNKSRYCLCFAGKLVNAKNRK